MHSTFKKTRYKRLNITLPEEVIETLKERIGDREVSNFISEAVKTKFKELEKEKIKSELIEGYKATKKEDMEIHKDFEGTFADGLDND